MRWSRGKVFAALALLSLLFLVPIACTSCTGGGGSATRVVDTSSIDGLPQLGLNFIRFYWPKGKGAPMDTTTPYLQPAAIFKDFDELGAQCYRQFVRADLLWNVVEPRKGQWDFAAADAVLKTGTATPIATLFANQYASPTPPWYGAGDTFSKTLGPEAKEYLSAVVERYGKYVKYWELGNEMSHWRAADPGDAGARRAKLPACLPTDGFSPAEQGRFLAETASFIKERDPDAVIVMPGMPGFSDYEFTTWLPGVVGAAGQNTFDVINYHYYGEWSSYAQGRSQLSATLSGLGLSGKPVWNTETGSTASPTLTLRTDYPNTPESQAADVFRRIVQAYAAGDSLVCWHTYISSDNTPSNEWRLYGLRTADSTRLPSYDSFKLLGNEIVPFVKVDAMPSSGQYVFKITRRDGGVRYVAWGGGSLAVPDGISSSTSVITDAAGDFSWQTVTGGKTIALSDVPVLLK
jgi:hypothetical protein